LHVRRDPARARFTGADCPKGSAGARPKQIINKIIKLINKQKMDIETLRDFCLALPEVSEEMPFGDTVLVFKVGGKIFALTSLDGEETSLNLKCAPDYAEYLRERWAGDIIGGYHMNKKHWNTVFCERGELETDFLQDLILHSYQLILQGLRKAERERLLALAAAAGLVFRLPPPLTDWA
jgi:predicted DNA-binding protein (MmcQ/YjbR family)